VGEELRELLAWVSTTPALDLVAGCGAEDSGIPRRRDHGLRHLAGVRIDRL
jgi:hypothetical protein